MTFIRIEHTSKSYGQTLAVDEVSLAIPRSTITVLLGRSGCGKTTILRLIAGLEKPDSGEIWIGSQQVSSGQAWVPATQRRVGMVFQDYALFPHLTVADNVAFGLTEMKPTARTPRVADLLDLVGLTGFEARYPHQLSGGQQQRVALARALAPAPDVVLLDEPFSNLDAALRQTLREEVRSILHEADVTTIFVTHDQEEALRLADELVVLEDGRVLQHGPPENVYRYPANLNVARFLGEVNIIPGDARSGTAQTALGPVPLNDSTLAGPVAVVLRPETMTLYPDLQSPILVQQVNYFGFHYLVVLQLEDGQTVQARTWAHTRLKAGTRVQVTVTEPTAAFPRE